MVQKLRRPHKIQLGGLGTMKCPICGQKMKADGFIHLCKYCQEISLVPHSENLTNKGAFKLDNKKADKVIRKFKRAVKQALNEEIL